jgi:hypothetical protein
MAKTLLEVFTESKKNRSKNKGARARGSRAEILLVNQLIEQGYEVRRSHLSAFPDVIAWNERQFLLIEVKSRTNNTGISNALSLFKKSAKLLKVVHNDALLLCYVRFNGSWHVYKWTGSDTIKVAPYSYEER